MAYKFKSILACALLISGCGYNEAIFITSTAIGINAETTPPNVAIAYERFEGFVGPTDENGNAPPVIASIESNQSVLDPRVRQLYATGEAALDVTVPTDAQVQKRIAAIGQTAYIEGDRRVAIFTVNSTTGLKVALNPETVFDSIVLGYKRQEASFLPLIEADDGKARYPSTLAIMRRNVQIGTAQETEDGVSQFFATGDAARNLAVRDDIRAYMGGVAREELAKTLPIYVRYTNDETYQKSVDEWVAQNKTAACSNFAIIEFSDNCKDLRDQLYKNFGSNGGSNG